MLVKSQQIVYKKAKQYSLGKIIIASLTFDNTIAIIQPLFTLWVIDGYLTILESHGKNGEVI